MYAEGRGNRGKGRGRERGAAVGYDVSGGGTPLSEIEVGSEVEGWPTSFAQYGVYMDIGAATLGFLSWRKSSLNEGEVWLGCSIKHLVVDSVNAELGRIQLRGPIDKSGRDENPWGEWKSQEKATRSRPPQQHWDAWDTHGWDEQSAWWSSVDQKGGGRWEAAGDSWWNETWQVKDVDASWDVDPNSTAVHADSTDEAADGRTFSMNPLAESFYPSAGSTSKASAQEKQPIAKRTELIVGAFKLFDLDGDGRLTIHELRAFASKTGFEGTDEEWRQEYQMLCNELKCQASNGVNVHEFETMVNDASDNGCYCSDDELAAMIAEAPKPEPAHASAGRSPSVAPAAPAVPKAVSSDQHRQPSTREELKDAVFRHFDKDADGRLRSNELRQFAEQTGFEGSDEEWQHEYSLLCQEYKRPPPEGLDQVAFNAMVDDNSADGCYCSDEELRAMLGTQPSDLTSKVVEPSQTDPKPTTSTMHGGAGHIPQTREALKAAVFRLHDVDKDGYLKYAELGAFASKAGFDGSPQEWKAEYESICQELKISAALGINEALFGTMVDDESENGCYCSNEDFADMLRQAAAKESQPNPRGDKASNIGDPWESQNANSAGPATSSCKGGGKSMGKRVDDPWETKQDPWSTPKAKRVHERQLDHDRHHDTKKSGTTEEDTTWGKWTEAASKPVLNTQKLLEASRAANAARKAKEEEAHDAKPAFPSTTQEDKTGNYPRSFEETFGQSSSSSADVSHRAPRITTTAAALSAAGSCIAQLAAGERAAASKLLDTIAGAPNSSHVLAVASSAIKLLLQGRLSDARNLLGLQDLLMDPSTRDGPLLHAVTELARSLDHSAAPLLLRALVPSLVKIDDKNAAIRTPAIAASEEIIASVDGFAFEALVQPLLTALDAKRSPTVKLHALRLLEKCWHGEGAKAVAHKLPQLLPVVTTLLLDTNNDVRATAGDCVEVLFALSDNRDLEPFLDDILSCVRSEKDVAKCVKDLAEVVFVQQFEAPALAVIMPVLTRGLKSRNMRTQRQACIIAANVCRLVPSMADVQPFAPQLLPLLKRVSEDTADPDVRQVASRAHQLLADIAAANMAGSARDEMRKALAEASSMAETDAKKSGEVFTPCPPAVRDVIIGYIVILCVGLTNCHVLAPTTWRKTLMPHLEPLLGDRAGKMVDGLLEIGRSLSSKHVADEDVSKGTGWDNEDETSDDAICDCTFTLACGAATLLSGARLKLMRGCVYGLVGANDSGKSALLRAIHDRKVVGFPPASELVSTLVEHGIGEKPPECDLTPLEYLLADPMIKALQLSKAKLVSGLKSLGFEDAGRSKAALKTLSGGWRMKLGLARAMLQVADVLLLDEPTGHLDAKHVDWLVGYLGDLQKNQDLSVTTVIVSHSAEFLDRVCTHIIHVQDQQLMTYAGNFSTFMENVPGAQLGSATGEEERPVSAFVLPDPGSLPGVKSRGKKFLSLEDVSYSYPDSTHPAIVGATAECSMRSRVAIVGPNGAGKSTLAALLVGELAPDLGYAWRHPNLRMAFVAQHTFHHLEKHAELTATQYILWRFEGNEDREALEFRAEEAEMEESRTYCFSSDGKLVSCNPHDPDVAEPDIVVDRRQRGQLGYEYEVKWRSPSRIAKTTSWVPRYKLAAMGYLGMALREDARQAAQHSLVGKLLTTPAVEAHLACFGMDAEEASHRRMSALSYGQRARAVLGAATWLAPHLLVLDEPSNYLDKPALAALAAGLQNFGGGVVVISHNQALLEEVCTERWSLDKGHILHGERDVVEDETCEQTSTSKASIAAMAAKEAKEKKKQKRIRELRRKNGEDVGEDDDEWWDELLKKSGGR